MKSQHLLAFLFLSRTLNTRSCGFPDYDFLTRRCGIHNLEQFKNATAGLLDNVDLKIMSTDFEHLLFNRSGSEKNVHCKKAEKRLIRP